MIPLMLPIVGCIDDDTVCPEEMKKDNAMTLEFTVVTRSTLKGGSRALVEPSNYDPQVGTAAENYLDLNNLSFLLFDSEGKVIRVFKPEVEVTPESAETYLTYSVRAFLSEDDFEALSGTKRLNANPNQQLRFSIGVVGNYLNLSPQRVGFHANQTIQEICNPQSVGVFEMPTRNNLYVNAWIPSIQNSTYTDALGMTQYALTPAHIPMSGLKTFSVLVKDLLDSSVSNPLNLSAREGDINMLRALAKIEIVDKIGLVGNTQPDIENRSWIEKVELVGHSTLGSLFPTLEQWNLPGNPFETQYVSNVSVPSDNTYVGVQPDGTPNFLPLNFGPVVNFFADVAATEARKDIDGCTVYSCYLTEYDPDNRGTAYPMWMRITAHGPGTAEGGSSFYRLEPAPYINNSAGELMPILRNNIYRYEIASVGTELSIQLIVDDWQTKVTEWSYNDNPAMTQTGYLEWNADAIIDKSLAQVTVTNTQTIEGTFTFSEPVNCYWYASFLREGETEPDAFEFVDTDDPLLASGLIDGTTSATIKIKAKYSPKDNDNRCARLIFTVRTLDGRVVSANVLDPGEYGKNTYFTINQNAAL